MQVGVWIRDGKFELEVRVWIRDGKFELELGVWIKNGKFELKVGVWIREKHHCSTETKETSLNHPDVRLLMT